MNRKNNLVYAYNKTSDAGRDTSHFSVFVDMCNLECPYCINKKIIVKRDESEFNPNIMEELKADVKEFKPEMIFISGGEPMIDADRLLSIITDFRSWGCKIGVSTNGIYVDTLHDFISKYKIIDYIAMDLKGDIDTYKKLGNPEYFMKVISSWMLLRKEKHTRSDFNYEIRTTLYPEYINEDMVRDLSKYFKKMERWVLQQFRVVPDMPDKNAQFVVPFTHEQLKTFEEIIRGHGIDVILRYV